MTVQPRFSETDALGHINNTVIPVWFETARTPIFKIFNPELDLTKWNLIIAKIDVNYQAQIHYPGDIEIKTYVKKLGNSSLTLLQEVYQNNQKVAYGECVMVKFDYATNKSTLITDSEKELLNSLTIS
jgi:acyl-CoA thioester hydrolase